ncbi:hypothetical protein EI200_04315 [Peribacillus simplex]|uniref:hypothetical protein n=1 Tax=Peribacillus simplex TaxID=1478 RepID=UPI000F638CBD|nr:hypothetical protein [Peribacillus simplex]RRN73911.1 hypothetical protein EI200_04315 [Peribacillus simplex]
MKKVLIGVISIVVLFIGVFFFLKLNQPLVAYPSASANDKQVQLISVGNKSPFDDIQIEEVLVNDKVVPSIVKLQVSYHPKGFIISDHFNGEEASEYTFKGLDSITLKPKTDPQKQLDKVNAGTATEDDTIYALSLVHEHSIDKVAIKYRHLGMPHELVVSTK